MTRKYKPNILYTLHLVLVIILAIESKLREKVIFFPKYVPVIVTSCATCRWVMTNDSYLGKIHSDGGRP